MLTPVAKNVLEKRYLQKDSNGKPIESIDDLWRRVANHAAKAEHESVRAEWAHKFYILLENQYFLFNSPTLVNAGTSINGLSACFVVGMEDSIDGIWQAKHNFAKIAQKGGGCGLNICDLRPKGMPVAGSTHAKAGGPIAFLETIWHDMEAMTQAGFRAMACMAVMRVDHPDIMDFITCKSPARALATQLTSTYAPCSLEEAEKIWRDVKVAAANGSLTLEQQKLVKLSENYLSNFNISVGITDAFTRAVAQNENISLHHDGVVYEFAKALDIWNAIAENAHASGDPGLMFLDTTNNTSPYRYSGQVIKATNPCGEQGLPANGVCNLGSVDVSKFVLNGAFDWSHYSEVCRTATRALNDIVDVASWPTQAIETWVNDNRPIGLGIMGFADACLLQGMRYGSEESLEFARQLVHDMYLDAEYVSIELGDERGIPTACQSLPEPRRNVTLLSIAPTGTISLIAGCSSGCEPVFDYVQTRQDNTGSYLMVHPAIKHQLGIDDIVYPVGSDQALMQKDAQAIVQRVTSLSDIFVSASDVSLEDHIKVQAAFQVAFGDGRCVDSGVSKTINMSNTATVEDVKAAYLLAHQLGCKGITVYRDGSKFFQILNTIKPATATVVDTAPPDHDMVDAKRFKVNYRGDRWYIIVGEQSGSPMEVFTFTNKEDDTLPTTDALARMISLALRYGAPVTKVVSQLRKVRQFHVGTFPAVIARVLSHYIRDDDATLDRVCTECGSKNIELVGGCPSCKDCGYSKCS